MPLFVLKGIIMRKIFSIFFLVSVLLLGFQRVSAASADLDFEQALNQKKPLLVLIYADWADRASVALNNFNNLKKSHGDKFNYLALNVADPSMKSYNKKYPIAPDMPYMVMFKNKGSVIRYVPSSCVVDNACITKKTTVFGH